MRLLRRVTTLLQSKITVVAEVPDDPRMIFGSAHVRRLALAKKTTVEREEVERSRERLQLQEAKARSDAERLTERARKAVMSGDDDEARFALRSKLAAERAAGILRERVARLTVEATRLYARELKAAREADTYFTRWKAAESRLFTTQEQMESEPELGADIDVQSPVIDGVARSSESLMGEPPMGESWTGEDLSRLETLDPAELSPSGGRSEMDLEVDGRLHDLKRQLSK